MGRYLTPGKIGLLSLLFVYSEGVVPAAATIPVLSFLVSCVNRSSDDSLCGASYPPPDPTEPTVQAIEVILTKHASGIPGRTVWDLFLNRIWKVISLDALHEFFEELQSLLQEHSDSSQPYAASRDRHHPIRFSRNSPLGLFTRRCSLEFTRLQFQDTVDLWERWTRYRDPSFRQWKKRNPAVKDAQPEGSSHFSHDAFLAARGPRTTRLALKDIEAGRCGSTYDADKMLEFQVCQMQKTGGRLPRDAVAVLRSMLADDASAPRLAYYIQFLEAWKIGDHFTSFDKLHQYFDYTMHDKDRTFYHYALLNLAALHADFGAYQAAIAAIRETIATAREHNDSCCLNYSLSWLFHFNKAFPCASSKSEPSAMMGTDKEALNFLKAKSKDAGMWSVFSSSLLGEARLSLTKGESPAETFLILLKASFVDVTKTLTAMSGTRAALLSTTFARLGISRQSLLLEKMFLNCRSPQASAEDEVQGRARLAHLLDLKGRSIEARRCIAEVDPEVLRVLKLEKSWTAQMGIIRLRGLLHRNCFNLAEQELQKLTPLRTISPDISHAIDLLEIEMLTQRQEYAMALNKIEDLTSVVDRNCTDTYFVIKCLVIKARIYEEAAMPGKGLSITLQAATMAHAARVLPMLWEALVALGAILNSMEEFGAATWLLENILPRVLEHEECAMIGRAFAVLADAYLGSAGMLEKHPIQQKERLHKASESIDEAFERYAQLRNVHSQCEMLAKKATIMQLNGDVLLANDCAAQSLSIEKLARQQGS